MVRFLSPIRPEIIAALLVVTVAACDSAEERVAGHYESGQALVEQGDDTRALLEFRNALRIDNGHVPTRFAFAQLHEREGNFQAALGHYAFIVENVSDHGPARTRMARILLAAGELERAGELIDEALAIDPDDALALAVSAAKALREGRVEDAIADAERALSIDPGIDEARFVLVAERSRAGDPQGALRVADDFLADTPEDRALNLLKLQILQTMGDQDAVLAHLRALVDLYDGAPEFRRALAQFHIARNDMEAAEAQIRASADHPDTGFEAVVELVRFINATRGADAAREELTARIDAAEDEETRFPMALARAELDYAAGRRDDARAALEGLVESVEDDENRRSAQLRLAQIALRESRFAEAVSMAEAVLEADDANPDALAIRAAVAIEDLRPGDAIPDLRAALDSAPQNVQLMLLEAQAHQLNGSAGLAGERLAQATRVSDYAPDVTLRYAAFLRGRGDVTAAESVLSEAARRNPSNRDVLTQLAELRLQLQDWIGADEVAEQLRALDGEAAAQIAAASLSGQGRAEDGIRLLESLVSGGVGDSDRAFASLVATYVRAGRTQDAINTVDAVLEREPDNVRALLLRAELHLLANEPDDAVATLRRVMDVAPANPIGYLAASRFALSQDRFDEAEAIIRDGLEKVENDATLRFILANIAERKKDFDAAIEEYARLYEMNPNSQVLANNYASLLAEFREADPEAMETARRVAQRLRDAVQPHFQDTYGWITFLDGRVEEALRHLTPAAEALPNNPLVRYHLGRALADAGQVEEARAELEASLELDPEFPKAASAQAALEALPQTAQN